MIKKVNFLLTRSQKLNIFLIFLGNLFNSVLEFISLGSIPVFISYIVSPNLTDNKFQYFIDIIFSFTNKENLIIIFLGIIFLVFLLKNFFLGLILFLEARFSYDFRKSLTNKLFKKYINLPYLFHTNTNPAKLVRNLTLEVGSACSVVNQMMIILRDTLLLIIVVSLIILVDPNILTPILFIISLIVGVFYKFFISTVRSRGKISQNKKASLIQKINESMGGIKEIKIMNLEKGVIKNFDRELETFEYQTFFIKVLNSFPKIILELTGIILIISIFYFFNSLNREIYEILPILSLAAVGLVRAIPSFNSIIVCSNNINFQRPAVDLITEELKRKTDIKKIESDTKRADNIIDFNDEIEIRNVDYKYSNRSGNALEKISLKVKKGDKIGIIGESGSGKTTLLNIILGLLKPNSGSIYIDKKDVFANNLESWQKKIGYVSQNIYLIDDSIRQNIALGEINIDTKKLDYALQKSNLKNFVNSLPEKADTIVGNNGIQLSGGQHQRIGIARALYHDPKILILDEATSSLDYNTEDEIFKDLESQSRKYTLIVVGHRLRTVAKCDLIYLIKKGKILDSGNFHEIMDKYSDLKKGTN